MRRVAVVAVLTLSAWLGSARAAEAQCLVTPVGPMALVLPAPLPSLELSTTPVARWGEGPHWALPPRDYSRPKPKRGVRRAE